VAGEQQQMISAPRRGQVLYQRLVRPFTVYARLFDARGARGFAVAGFVSRLTTSMVGLGLVLALTAGNRRYAVAGAVVSVLVLANAMAFPVAGRLADSRGQDWLLLRLTPAFALAMSAIIAIITWHGPLWALLPLGFLAGAMMPVAHTLVRARWTALYQGTSLLRAAYGFEGATTEVVFIVGPILVTLLATAIRPLAGLVATLLFAVTGALGLAVQRSTQPPPAGPRGQRAAGLWRGRTLRTVCVAEFGLGGVFGSVEIVTVGFSTAHHARGLTGLLLGLWGFASMLAGLAYGAIGDRGQLHRRAMISVALFAGGLIPLLFARSLEFLTVLLTVSGLTMAPATITLMEVVQRAAPAAAITEAVSWAGSGVVLGMTAGSLTGGWAVQHLGIGHVYAVPAAFGAFALLVTGAGYRVLRGEGQAPRGGGG
jgi:MFS family permease